MRLKSNNIWIKILLVTLCSCTPRVSDFESETGEANVPSIESLYDKAARHMQQRNFKAAASGFAKVQELYPYSKWATQAQLMEAYCRYQIHQYADAIDEFAIFCQLHPYHKETPYAYYMIGLSHYERISIVERDQEDAIKALEAFETVVRRYPTCNYAKDSKFKIDFIKNHLAAQEMQIGRFYQQERSYLAAINRFKNVVTKYETTEQIPEALMRLAECYAILNMKDEFLTMHSILQLNYPKSHWYHSVKKLHERYIRRPQPALASQSALPQKPTPASALAPIKGSVQSALPKQPTPASSSSPIKGSVQPTLLKQPTLDSASAPIKEPALLKQPTLDSDSAPIKGSVQSALLKQPTLASASVSTKGSSQPALRKKSTPAFTSASIKGSNQPALPQKPTPASATASIKGSNQSALLKEPTPASALAPIKEPALPKKSTTDSPSAPIKGSVQSALLKQPTPAFTSAPIKGSNQPALLKKPTSASALAPIKGSYQPVLSKQPTTASPSAPIKGSNQPALSKQPALGSPSAPIKGKKA